MNLVVLCKRHNHRKVLEILSALSAQGLQVRGLVALAPGPAKRSLKEVVRKIYYRRAALALNKNPAPNPHQIEFFNLNGKVVPHAAVPANGHLPLSQKRPFPADQNQIAPAVSSSPASAPQTIDAFAQAHHIPLVTVADLNGEACVAALRNFETDVLLLGGVPIIRANVLAMPCVGTLNVHMAWLPGIRGMNVAEWSVYCNAPVAVTVHFVDAGVDTGAVLYREQIEVGECRSISAMRLKLSAQQHLALARATKLLVDKKLQPEPQTHEAGKQFYLMHERLKRRVEEKLARGW